MILTSSEKEIARAYQGEDIIYPTPIRDGLVLWYDFKGRTNQDINRGVAVDLSGNGNDGELQNFAYTEGSGYGDGLDFDGVDDDIYTSIQGVEDFYFEILFKPLAPPSRVFDGVFLFGSDKDTCMVLDMRSYPAKVRVNCYEKDLSLYYTEPEIDYDGDNYMGFSLSEKTFKIHMGNSVIYERELKVGSLMESADSLYIGSRRAPYYANIDVKVVRLYNRALTPAEIRHNYEIEKTRWGL